MTYDEAETLTGFLRSAFPNITEDQASFFQARFPSLNAEEGSKAVLAGIKVWKFPPSWAEVIEFYKIERAKSQVEESRPIIEQGPKEPIPMWVKRWLYARYIHTPPDLRPFFEQRDHPHNEGEWMPEDAYVTEARSLTARQLNAAVQVAFGPRGPSDEHVIGVLRQSLGLSEG